MSMHEEDEDLTIDRYRNLIIHCAFFGFFRFTGFHIMAHSDTLY